jgi:hypothetical protein
LSADQIAALPFLLELPAGTRLTAGRPGPDFNIYAVRRGETPLVMIFVGAASQFPIFSGETILAGGRASTIVTEGGRRLALEHLFQRQDDPREIHIWVAAAEGADRDLAERIAQGVDQR